MKNAQLALPNKSSTSPHKKQLAPRNTSSTSRARARYVARWQARFLNALRKAPNVAHACRAAHVDRTTAYRHREENDVFARKWEEALSASVDRCEEKAFDMAWKGDSQLLQFILKAHRPERYRETQRVDVGLLGGIVLLPPKQEGEE
jgi:hypothetical protein